MVISGEDFKEMTVTSSRTTRTTDSERYILFSDDPEAGKELSSSSRNASRIGVLILQYASGALSRPYVGGTLILHTEWEEEAISGLVSLIDARIAGSIGAGMITDRETFDVSESVAEYTEPITSDEERGLYGIHKQMRQTQEMIESLPETLDGVIAEQYDEIKDIIEAQDLNEEEKRRRVRDKLRVGLEMGLPTIMYERSTE